MTELKSGVTVVLGGQWGDEGKGKLVDILAQEADIVARCQVRITSCTVEELASFLVQGPHPHAHLLKCIFVE